MSSESPEPLPAKSDKEHGGLARGWKKYAQPATPTPEAMTESNYIKVLDNIGIIEAAALKGDKEAARQLVKIALWAAGVVETMENYEPPKGSVVRPLLERRAMVKAIRDENDEWPSIKFTPRHGRLDEPRRTLNSILYLFRLVRRAEETKKETPFAIRVRNLPSESNDKKVVNEWADAIADYMIFAERSDLNKLAKLTNAKALMKKHQGRGIERAEKLKKDGDPKLDLRAETRISQLKKRKSPTPAEWKESLKKTVQSRLTAIFPDPPN
jgi:hypothetical protein